ncbi:MAG: class I adenylate cyclase [Thermodesulfobacteriota bacterium]
MFLLESTGDKSSLPAEWYQYTRLRDIFKQEKRMIRSFLTRNKKAFNEYLAFRKQLFTELAPKDSEDILYLLPWLLSINHKACPGYVAALEKPFRIFGIDNDRLIRSREENFKQRFGVPRKGSLLAGGAGCPPIEGVYTIGSVGTVSQTSASDCDIWVCCDKTRYSATDWRRLNQKINLIKDWMDQNLRLPVYFFLTDIEDIRHGRFGRVDMESAGSTQKNVLKEEFYRTCIVICGKLPLWWLTWDGARPVDYRAAATLVADRLQGHYDIIDFGDLDAIGKAEYLGAALWHLHKSLNNPIKSIIKMFLLKILLDAPEGVLICHQFRSQVLGRETGRHLLDPSIFAMGVIFNQYALAGETETLAFLKQCFYLRCRIKPYDRRHVLKKELIGALFSQFPLDLATRIRLGGYDGWPFNEQIKLGSRLFGLIMKTYREIMDAHAGIAGDIDQKDLKILGRKISASFQKKEHKVPVLPKPTGTLNLSGLTLRLTGGAWAVFSENDPSVPIVVSDDIVYNIAFIVWNHLFIPHRLFMEPNPSQVTLQEIINLGRKMTDFIGRSMISENEFSHYLNKELLTKLMVVVSFEQSPWEKNINDFRVVYKNNWGELFVRRFSSHHKLNAFLSSWGERHSIDTTYYLQRNSSYYEKIIERTKNILFPALL